MHVLKRAVEDFLVHFYTFMIAWDMNSKVWPSGCALKNFHSLQALEIATLWVNVTFYSLLC